MRYLKFICCFLFLFVLCGCSTTVSVTFVNSVNGEVIEIIEVKKGDSLTYPNEPIIEGYEFIGWDKELSSFESDSTITAYYEALKYTVKFYHNNAVIDTQEVSYGDAAVAPNDPNPPIGKYFAGWDYDINCIKEDITINPIFKDLEYLVKFYDIDGNIISEQTVLYGKKAEAPDAPVLNDYQFVGWDTVYTNVKENLEIKPIYELLTYEVKFVDKYGDVIKTEEVRPNANATAPEMEEIDYYEFTGWDKEFENVTSDLVVTAVYQENKENLKIENVEYWLQILSDKYNINKEILSVEKINAYNKVVLDGYSKTKVVDVLKLGETISGSSVRSLINSYTNISKYNVYNNDTKTLLTNTEENEILSKRNLNQIPTTVTIQYGIVTDFAWMRS